MRGANDRTGAVARWKRGPAMRGPAGTRCAQRADSRCVTSRCFMLGVLRPLDRTHPRDGNRRRVGVRTFRVIYALRVRSSRVQKLTYEEVLQIASDEGLTLVESPGSKSGYKNVHVDRTTYSPRERDTGLVQPELARNVAILCITFLALPMRSI